MEIRGQNLKFTVLNQTLDLSMINLFNYIFVLIHSL